MIKRIIISVLLITSTALFVVGQEAVSDAVRQMPQLQYNSDVRSAGMGDAHMGRATNMYLYTNPTSFLDVENKVYADYSIGIFRKVGDDRINAHAFSAGYRFGKNALMVGVRHMGGLKVPVANKTLKPFDMSLDVSYARKLNEFSIYATAGMIQSKPADEKSSTFSASIGGYYNNYFDAGGRDFSYNVGVAVRNIGGDLKYDGVGSGDLKMEQPTSIDVGGSLTMPFSANHKLDVALTGQYYLRPSDASEFVFGGGLEYTMFNLAAIRAGYHVGDKNNYFTAGLGFDLKYATINFAYSLRTGSGIGSEIGGMNKLLRLGVGFKF